MPPTSFELNGRQQSLDVPAEMPVLWALRDKLQLTGTKVGCGAALCGACTVLVDGAPARSCQLPLQAVAGRKVTSIEGLQGREADAVRDAWTRLDVAQCGWCQSGQVVAATALLREKPKPTDADIVAAMAGNLCRCGTYQRVRKGIHAAAEQLRRAA